MYFTLFALFEAAILASSMSLDALAAGFAYGTNKTKIPMLSAFIINLICTGVTGLALLIGAILKPYLPAGLTVALAFAILLTIGLIKLLDSITKSIIRKHNHLSKEINGSLFNFKFVLNVYANPEAADIDSSKSLSSSEAVLLAVSLSLDGIAVGFGAALVNINVAAVILWSLFTNVGFLLGGHLLGQKLSAKLSFNFSWLGGVALIALAVSKLV
ncbi:MAG: sporulation membrane protein YtaF [Lachnospiraceae bacterium]|nr:sporulation membrane protein YtaF [Lachnospiraceae bacterium]